LDVLRISSSVELHVKFMLAVSDDGSGRRVAPSALLVLDQCSLVLLLSSSADEWLGLSIVVVADSCTDLAD
jgi:hypothetical protein